MKPRSGNAVRLLLTAVTLAVTPFFVHADDTLQQTTNSAQIALDPGPAPPADPWRFTIAPLLWGAGVNGNVTVGGRTADVDVGFDKIIKHTDLGFMAYFEARKNIFGFFAQPNYLKLSGDGSAGPLSASYTQKLWIVEGGAFVQMVKWGEERPLTVDALFGARYWSINQELSIEAPPLGSSFNGSKTSSIIDPLIGLNIQQYLTKKFSVLVRGDIGGFGISDSTSKLSWQGAGMLDYDFCRNFSVFGGYRALGLDEKSGSGSRTRGVDIIMNGVLLGLKFRF